MLRIMKVAMSTILSKRMMLHMVALTTVWSGNAVLLAQSCPAGTARVTTSYGSYCGTGSSTAPSQEHQKSEIPCPPGTTRIQTSYGSYCGTGSLPTESSQTNPQPYPSVGNRVSGAGIPSFLFRMDTVMTPQEYSESGIAGLMPLQRAALDKWLNRFIDTVIQAALQSQPALEQPHKSVPDTHRYQSTSYFGTGSGHWIQTVSGNGAIVQLEDGSVWSIDSIDQIDTALWLPITDITVLEGRYGGYILVNTEDGEQAHATYLGAH
jgi:hypothetical protein